MRFVDCAFAEHGDAIRAIFNEAIETSTSVYDYGPRSRETIESWFGAKHANGYPVIGAIDDDDRLLGFASYGPFRLWDGYKYTVEHSVYVEKSARGRGIGEALLRRVIEHARASDYHVTIGAIDGANTASIALHRKLGFELAGTMREVGFKFGRWLDVVFYQLRFDTPSAPTSESLRR
jgi:phosphinothricin acetyltransferase